MTNPEVLRVARLEAVAAVRAHVTDNNQRLADLIVGDTEDAVELARAAVGFASSLLLLLPASTRQRVLDGLLGAAVGDVDDGPAST